MEALLKAEGLSIHFPVGKGLLARLLTRNPSFVRAVDGVDLVLYPGEILGLVGESGSGKTTLGRTLIRLIKPTAGKIYFEGKDITDLSEARLRPLRRRIQVVFQDPHAALNPAMKVGRAIADPVLIHGLATTEEEAKPRVLEIMEEVGLSPAEEAYDKLPWELSGGQKQRAVIARAIILRPSLIVADEPVAMLDMSVRARILELLLDLKRRYNLTYLFITHDLATAKFLCNRIAIMYLGKIVEEGPAQDVYAGPKHPYTQALLRAIPVPDPRRRSSKQLPRGEIPDAIVPPANCRFHPRCPVAVQGCGWEPRDLLNYLEERRTRLGTDALARDERLLGEFETASVEGQLVKLRAREGTTEELEAYLREVVAADESSMFKAIQGIRREGDQVAVRFAPWTDLREVSSDGRRVLCILYQ